MVFTELNFWFFFAIVMALYVVLPHRLQNRMLLVASYTFYGAWDWRFLGLLMLSTTVDYLVATRMDREQDPILRRRLLTISVMFNLTLLGFFKYFNFFVGSFHDLMQSFGYDANLITLSVVLPVGISFYTFQSLSYTLDVYRRELKAETHFLDFALFVSFFPQLVAGPIERATALLPRIKNPRTMTWDAIGRGSVLCLTGLIKKSVIADGVAPSVNAIFSSPDPSRLDVILATWLFAVQIYCDFSGYSDIARGLAKIMGFDLMRNFAQPFFSANPQDFWRRWHISLSTWLRDYLYISLGGNRKGRWKTYRNLMATMVIGGLWHGAAWNFVLWGVYQGGLLAGHRALAGRQRAESAVLGAFDTVKRVVGIVLFFQVVCYGWLLFRAQSFGQIADFTGRIFGFVSAPGGLSIPTPPFAALLGIGMLLIWDVAIERSDNPRFYDKLPAILRALLYAVMVYFLAFGMTATPSTFIYFQF